MWTNREKVIIATTALTNMNPDFKLDFWQEWFLCQNFQFTHCLKSRRVGYSYINSMRALIQSSHPKTTKYQKVLVSYNMSDSMEKIKEVRNIYMNLPDEWKKPLVTDSKTALEFWDEGKKSKSQIISLPNRALRGFGTANKEGGVLIDEMPMISDVESIYTSAIPSLARGGTMDVGGTPLCKDGLFYEIAVDKGKYPDFKRMVIPWWFSSVLCENLEVAMMEAESLSTYDRVDRFGTSILKTIFRNSGLHQFQQEFEVQFQDENEAFITMEMIMRCTPQEIESHEYTDIAELLNGRQLNGICTGFGDDGKPIIETVDAPAYDPEIHGFLYGGWDMGRTKDASIFTLIGEKDGKLIVWMTYELKNKSFDEQREFVRNVLTALPIRKFLLDSTGLGMEFAEWAEKEFPTVAYGVHFTNEKKEDMANKVYLGCERATYVFPNNRKLHADIHCIRKTTTSMMKNRYDGSTKDSHADRFWSLALATVGADSANKNISQFYKGYQKVKTREIHKEIKIVKTGNSELDRIKRLAHRGRRRNGNR